MNPTTKIQVTRCGTTPPNYAEGELSKKDEASIRAAFWREENTWCNILDIMEAPDVGWMTIGHLGVVLDIMVQWEALECRRTHKHEFRRGPGW